jgi:hypothetical protein
MRKGADLNDNSICCFDFIKKVGAAAKINYLDPPQGGVEVDPLGVCS